MIEYSFGGQNFRISTQVLLEEPRGNVSIERIERMDEVSGVIMPMQTEMKRYTER